MITRQIRLFFVSSAVCLGLLAVACSGSAVVATPAATSITIPTPTANSDAAYSPTPTVSPTGTNGPTAVPIPTETPLPTAIVAPTSTLVPTATAVPIGQRTTVDRPDDSDLPQIHLVYALASDGVDRFFDTNGAIKTSVESVSYWFRTQSGDLDLRWDTYNGELDVTFFRLDSDEKSITAWGAYVRDVLEQELKAAGAIQGNKQYMVFYDGASTYSCGGGPWPPLLYGVVGALYLKGLPDSPFPCDTNTLGASSTAPGYLDIAMFHEFIHALGITPTCAPNQHSSGHVSDSPNDLMWAGDAPWNLPPKLDIGNDDYFRHGNPDCPDLANVGYIDPLPADYWLPPGVSR